MRCPGVRVQGEAFSEAEAAALRLLSGRVVVSEELLTHVVLLGLTPSPLDPGMALFVFTYRCVLYKHGYNTHPLCWTQGGSCLFRVARISGVVKQGAADARRAARPHALAVGLQSSLFGSFGTISQSIDLLKRVQVVCITVIRPDRWHMGWSHNAHLMTQHRMQCVDRADAGFAAEYGRLPWGIANGKTPCHCTPVCLLIPYHLEYHCNEV